MSFENVVETLTQDHLEDLKSYAVSCCHDDNWM